MARLTLAAVLLLVAGLVLLVGGLLIVVFARRVQALALHRSRNIPGWERAVFRWRADTERYIQSHLYLLSIRAGGATAAAMGATLVVLMVLVIRGR